MMTNAMGYFHAVCRKEFTSSKHFVIINLIIRNYYVGESHYVIHNRRCPGPLDVWALALL
jgi:hypothetical protein